MGPDTTIKLMICHVQFVKGYENAFGNLEELQYISL